MNYKQPKNISLLRGPPGERIKMWMSLRIIKTQECVRKAITLLHPLLNGDLLERQKMCHPVEFGALRHVRSQIMTRL